MVEWAGLRTVGLYVFLSSVRFRVCVSGQAFKVPLHGVTGEGIRDCGQELFLAVSKRVCG